MARGKKTGGRARGTPNRRTRVLREVTNKALESGEAITPQEFMLSLVNNRELDLPLRLEAAKAVAQFVHPKLSAVHNVNEDLSDRYMLCGEPLTEDEWNAAYCQPTIAGRGQQLGVTMKHVDALRLEVIEAENANLKEELARLKRAAEERELTPQEFVRRLPVLS